MTADLALGLVLGAAIGLAVVVKVLIWALAAAGRLLLRWISGSL